MLEICNEATMEGRYPMNRATALFAAGLATLLLTGPAIAKDPMTSQATGTTKDSTTTTPEGKSSSGRTGASAPAEKPGTLAMPHHASGRVVSVDKKDNSVTIKDSKGKEMTLVADADTAADVARLKSGDEVQVTYKKSKDQIVATKITTTAPSAPRTK